MPATTRPAGLPACRAIHAAVTRQLSCAAAPACTPGPGPGSGEGGVLQVLDEDLEAAFRGYVPPAFWGVQRSDGMASQVRCGTGRSASIHAGWGSCMPPHGQLRTVGLALCVQKSWLDSSLPSTRVCAHVMWHTVTWCAGGRLGRRGGAARGGGGAQGGHHLAAQVRPPTTTHHTGSECYRLVLPMLAPPAQPRRSATCLIRAGVLVGCPRSWYAPYMQ